MLPHVTGRARNWTEATSMHKRASLQNMLWNRFILILFLKKKYWISLLNKPPLWHLRLMHSFALDAKHGRGWRGNSKFSLKELVDHKFGLWALSHLTPWCALPPQSSIYTREHRRSPSSPSSQGRERSARGQHSVPVKAQSSAKASLLNT